MVLRRTAQPACSGGSRYCSCRSSRIFGHAGRQVVVEQDRAGIEVLQAEAARRAHQRLERERAAVGQRHLRRRGDRSIERAEAHVEAGLVEDLASAAPRSSGRTSCACASRGSAAGSSPPGRSSRSPPSPPARPAAASRSVRLLKPPGNRLVSTGASLKPALRRSTERVERRRVLHPLEPEPALDRRHRLEHALLEFVDRAGEGGDEMGNHAGACDSNGAGAGGAGAGILGIWGARGADASGRAGPAKKRATSPAAAATRREAAGQLWYAVSPCDVMSRPSRSSSSVHAQADRHVDELVGDQRDHARPDDRHAARP